MSDKRPTIAELEAILQKTGGEVEIAPDGKVTVKEAPCPRCAELEKVLNKLVDVERDFIVPCDVQHIAIKRELFDEIRTVLNHEGVGKNGLK